MRKFNEKICKVAECLTAYRLTLYMEKKTICEIIFTRINPESDTFIKLNNVILRDFRTVEYLGVIRFKSLKCKHHFKTTSDKKD